MPPKARGRAPSETIALYRECKAHPERFPVSAPFGGRPGSIWGLNTQYWDYWTDERLEAWRNAEQGE